MRELVLASSSPYRAELLRRLGLPFEIAVPDIDETGLARETAHDLVERLARRKAAAVAEQHPRALIIGSDQVAECAGRILGKPGTAERARAQLAELSGQNVTFLTGLCLLDAAAATEQCEVIPTTVHFRTLTAAQIADYVARERPLDCAGAFKSEGLGVALLQALEGSDPNALVGLPLIALCTMLMRAGVDVLGSGSSLR